MGTTQEGSPDSGEVSHRESIAEEIDRRTIIAEAKLLVHQLDTYLELIGEWAAEDWEDEDAGH